MFVEERSGDSASGEVAREERQPKGVRVDHQKSPQLAQEAREALVLLQTARKIPSMIINPSSLFYNFDFYPLILSCRLEPIK